MQELQTVHSFALAGTLVIASGGGCARGVVGPPEPIGITVAEASRFLTRATYGPSPDGVDELLATGYSAWIDAQIATEPSLLAPALLEIGCSIVQPEFDGYDECDFIDPHISALDLTWWEHSVYGDDQLRQRVALALSEILVVSFNNAVLAEFPVLLADYYDTLAVGAFGSYRDLLEDVTLHPAMGIYLSMLGNRKLDPIAGTRPDENYARELMQLFSIGLVRLDATGVPLLDADGATIPTYDQDDIEELARVLTGWTFGTPDPKTSSLEEFQNVEPLMAPMEPWPAFHDDGSKLVLDDVFVPAGLAPEDELDLVLDALASHPNVAPFMSRQLIQRLVTSNPSPDYVARVVAVWNDDGTGTSGNLARVVRAILLDQEALDGTQVHPEFGKVREPLLRATALWRAFEAWPIDDIEAPAVFEEFDGLEAVGQKALYAPSVFNFFSPSYSTTELMGQGLVGPELQISTHATLTQQADFLQSLIFGNNSVVLESGGLEMLDPALPVLEIEPLLDLAADVEVLVDWIDQRLFGGTMSTPTRDGLSSLLEGIGLEEGEEGTPPGLERVLVALSTAVSTPDYLVQK